jgi:hypothetical protein
MMAGLAERAEVATHRPAEDNDMRKVTDNDSYKAIDWLREAHLCLNSALTLLRHDPEAMRFAYQTRCISDDVNRLCERIEPVERHRQVKSEGVGAGVVEIAMKANSGGMGQN